MIENKLIKKWWKSVFPNETLLSIQKPKSGNTTQTFILNRNKILKIYISKDGKESREDFFVNTRNALGLLDGFDQYLVRLVGIFENNEIFGAFAICMSFVESTDLSRILHKIEPNEVFDNGQKIDKIIKQMHAFTTIRDQEYDTQKLLDSAQKALDFACENSLLNEQDYAIIERFLSNYKARIIKTDFVLVHNDLHSENYLMSKDGSYFLIDFDMSFVGWRVLELRKHVYAVLIPSYLVNDNLQKNYPNKFTLEFWQGLVSSYPELFDVQYIDEIKLLNLPQILYNLKKLEGIRYDLTIDLFNMIYKENVLEEILY